MAGALDCAGDLVLPGLVELHTDNVERHIEPRPEVDWPHLPALLAHDAELAGAGITTVFDAMRVGSIHSGKGRYIDYARTLADELLAARAQGLFKISHFLHLRAETCSETLLEELAAFSPEDRVGIVSLMDHTPGQRQFRDLSALKAYVAKKRGMTDAEFAEHVESLLDLRRRFGAKHEAGAVTEATRLGAVLASHDDTTAEHVATSAQNGVGFAEFPTTVEAAKACRSHGIAVMMGAPNLIRGGSHSGNVAAEDLARQDLLDIVSSDYVPAALLLSAFRSGRDLGRSAARGGNSHAQPGRRGAPEGSRFVAGGFARRCLACQAFGPDAAFARGLEPGPANRLTHPGARPGKSFPLRLLSFAHTLPFKDNTGEPRHNAL